MSSFVNYATYCLQVSTLFLMSSFSFLFIYLFFCIIIRNGYIAYFLLKNMIITKPNQIFVIKIRNELLNSFGHKKNPYGHLLGEITHNFL